MEIGGSALVQEIANLAMETTGLEGGDRGRRLAAGEEPQPSTERSLEYISSGG